MSFQHLFLVSFFTRSYTQKWGDFIDLARQGRILSLETFWQKSLVERALKTYPEVKIFLDSGAYTMHTKGVKDVQGYMDSYVEFISKYHDRFYAYANLDEIDDFEESWRRQKYMEGCGLNPIPVYHFEEKFEIAEKYLNEYDYVAIGGLASGKVSSRDLTILLDRIFEYIYKKGLSTKIHGFALFSVPFLLKYPLFSSDATTWMKFATYGNVIIPKYDELRKCFDFCRSPTTIRVSEYGLYLPGSGGGVHYTLRYPEGGEVRARIEQYFDMVGVDKELLKTSYYERVKVGVYFFERVAEELRKHKPTFRVRKSFFL